MIDKLETIFTYTIMSPLYILVGIKKLLKKILSSNHRVLKMLFTFYLTSLLLFYYGPINYPKVNTLYVVIYISGYLGCFLLGYYFSIVFRNKQSKPKKTELKINWLLFDIGLTLGTVLSLLSLVSIVGNEGIGNIIEKVILGLSNPEIAYGENLEMIKEGGLLTQLSTLLSPITFIVLPIGMYFFKDMLVRRKLFYVLYVCLEVMTYISKGTNFGIFKIAVILITIFFIKTQNMTKEKKKMRNVAMFIGVFTVFYFFFSITSRMAYTKIPTSIFFIPIDQNSLLFKILPPFLSLPILTGLSYATQGFYGFSLAFSYNFTSTYGFGSGRFLISLPERLFNVDLWEKTYQYKMDSIWSSRVNWHTAFTWIANDVGFFGVLIVMLILGTIFGFILKEATQGENILAISLLPLYMIILIFLPLNNIVLDNPLTAVPFIVLNMLWIMTKLLRRN